MTADEIHELFIAAAEIDRRLPNTARPAQIKSMSMPYVFDWMDKLGWGSERLDEERKEFWDNLSNRLNPNDVTLWERASELIRTVGNQGQRRALLHWSAAKAGGRPFAQWCRKVEKIHEETGRRRKDRAVLSIISAQSCVSGASTHELDFAALLPNEPETPHIEVIIGQSRSWMAEGSRPLICAFDAGLKEYAWADRENERRRQRDAKRRQQAA
jgi:hypothetical protein